MKHYEYLDSDNKVQKYLQSLKERQISLIAVDIEGEFNLHHYGEHLCLVQIFDLHDYILIDPQTVSINLIRGFFEDTRILKIMYDCSGDRTVMFRKYGISINSILDLYPAVELLNYQKKNLNSVLHSVLGLKEKPKKKFQRYNWMKRPVDTDALNYAIDDVKYLFDLKAKLMEEIIAENLLDSYILQNMEIQNRPVLLEFIPGVFKKERFRKLKSQSKDIFKKLFMHRDKYAEQLDLPPNSVVSNDDLFCLSSFEIDPRQITFSRNISSEIRESIKREFIQILN